MRKVQVFKATQQRDEEGDMQTIMEPKFVGTFHQFCQGADEQPSAQTVALSRSNVGSVPSVFAVIEREDGSIVTVNATLIKFIEPEDALAIVDGSPVSNLFRHKNNEIARLKTALCAVSVMIEEDEYFDAIKFARKAAGVA